MTASRTLDRRSAAHRARFAHGVLALLVGVSGCRWNQPTSTFYDSAAANVAYAPSGDLPSQIAAENPVAKCEADDVCAEAPMDFDPDAPIEYRDLTLEEAIQYALANTRVMRDLGGTISTPDALLSSVYDPALAFSDPRTGEEAALSAFDATFAASAFFEKNDREFNNTFVGDDGQLTQDLGNANFEFRKQTATGTQVFLRHLLEHDFNNNVGNRFNGGLPLSESFQAILEGEIRQPLLQGAGTLYNRIAGPDAEPGQLNGVLLARTRTDISLTQFEVAVRDLVANVENAYWDLYFSYRDLDAKKRARDYALETYQSVAAQAEGGLEGGENKNVGQALEQYWRYESEVVNAQTGRTLDGTRTGNGSRGGTNRSAVGVRLAERRLRLIIGMPINGGPILRPADEPNIAPVSFDWETLTTRAFHSRPELRRPALADQAARTRTRRQPQLAAAAARRGRPVPLAWLRRGPDLASQPQLRREPPADVPQRLRRPGDRRLPRVAARRRARGADRLPPRPHGGPEHGARPGPLSGDPSRAEARRRVRPQQLDGRRAAGLRGRAGSVQPLQGRGEPDRRARRQPRRRARPRST